jgi:simple sugar transport system permease protein
MQLRLEPRALQSRAMRYASPLIAAALTLVMGFILFAALGKNPPAAFYAFFIAPFTSVGGLAELFL